jgi:hypothetical protein
METHAVQDAKRLAGILAMSMRAVRRAQGLQKDEAAALAEVGLDTYVRFEASGEIGLVEFLQIAGLLASANFRVGRDEVGRDAVLTRAKRTGRHRVVFKYRPTADNPGSGVEFRADFGAGESVLVALLEGFGWRDEKDADVRIVCLYDTPAKADAARVPADVNWADVQREASDAVHAYLLAKRPSMEGDWAWGRLTAMRNT